MEPPLSAGFITISLLFLILFIAENSCGLKLYRSSETIYCLPVFSHNLFPLIISVVKVSIFSMVCKALAKVPFLNKIALFGIQVDFSTKVFFLESKTLELSLKAHLILILLINLFLFSKILATGSNLGVGIKDRPFSKRDSSAWESFTEDKF